MVLIPDGWCSEGRFHHQLLQTAGRPLQWKWYKKTHRTVTRMEVTGAPQSDDETGRGKKPAASADKDGIHVTIKTRDGLFVQKGGLDYQGLRLLVERLEVLC